MLSRTYISGIDQVIVSSRIISLLFTVTSFMPIYVLLVCVNEQLVQLLKASTIICIPVILVF